MVANAGPGGLSEALEGLEGRVRLLGLIHSFIDFPISSLSQSIDLAVDDVLFIQNN